MGGIWRQLKQAEGFITIGCTCGERGKQTKEGADSFKPLGAFLDNTQIRSIKCIPTLTEYLIHKKSLGFKICLTDVGGSVSHRIYAS